MNLGFKDDYLPEGEITAVLLAEKLRVKREKYRNMRIVPSDSRRHDLIIYTDGKRKGDYG